MAAISLPFSLFKLSSLRPSAQQQAATTGVPSQDAMTDVPTPDAGSAGDDSALLGCADLPVTARDKSPAGNQPSTLELRSHVDSPGDNAADGPLQEQERAVAGPPVQTYGTWSSGEIFRTGMKLELSGCRCGTGSL